MEATWTLEAEKPGLNLQFILYKTQMFCLQNSSWKVRDGTGKPLSKMLVIEILASYSLDLRVSRANPLPPVFIKLAHAWDISHPRKGAFIPNLGFNSSRSS